MEKVKILVACHKPAKVFKNEVYTPIQVGKALNPNLDLGYITDDTGDNISAKNNYYSELTAQYWAWKNLHDVEYVGLCHYQRYFHHQITAENIDAILGNHANVLLLRPLTEWMNLAERLALWTSREDVYIFYKSFEKVHPCDFEKFTTFLNQNKFSPFNMFIMRKEEFDKFAEWQFAIFFEMEKYVRPSNYARQKRLYGYLSEILLSAYTWIRMLKVTYDSVTDNMNQEIWTNTLRHRYERFKVDVSFKLSHGFRKNKRKFYFDFKAVETGMKQDGITL